MEKNYVLYIEDIIDSIDIIENNIKNIDFDTFLSDITTQDATLRRLEIIGEAATKIPKDVKERYDNVPWKKIIATRNIIIHQYSDVDVNLIWEIIHKNLPETKEDLEYMLGKEKFR
jgi:uncharacterized protein with HEPN domain